MQLDKGFCQPSPVSLRLNHSRQLPTSINGWDGTIPWCDTGVYLDHRPSFTADPLLHAGAYYVQEASSMFLWHGLKHLIGSGLLPTDTGLCLDLCAAPGGKSTLLRSALPSDFLLIANEPIRPRAQVLAENLAKWGAENTIVTNLMPEALITRFTGGRLIVNEQDSAHCTPPALSTLSHGIDLLVCDVPCSGEGMFRKEDEAVRQWSPSLVEECARLQRSIVATAWDALQPGGILIYSTCTFNPLEDEANVLWICHELGGEAIDIPYDPQWGILRYTDLADTDSPNASTLTDGNTSIAELQTTLTRCLHFIPGYVRGEGFFCAFIRKSVNALQPAIATAKTGKRHNAKVKDSKKAIAATDYCLPIDLLDDKNAPRVELSLTDANRYLRRESLILPPGTPTGIVQVCYQGQRLGLMKNLGARANNIYPKEWRIRSSHLEPYSLFSYGK